MAAVPHNHSLRDRAVKETTFGCFPSVMPQTFYYQFDNSAFHWSFLHRIEFSYEHSVFNQWRELWGNLLGAIYRSAVER